MRQVFNRIGGAFLDEFGHTCHITTGEDTVIVDWLQQTKRTIKEDWNDSLIEIGSNGHGLHLGITRRWAHGLQLLLALLILCEHLLDLVLLLVKLLLRWLLAVRIMMSRLHW